MRSSSRGKIEGPAKKAPRMSTQRSGDQSRETRELGERADRIARDSVEIVSADGEPTMKLGSADEHETIARRAYEIYIAEGMPDGRDIEHWKRAEQELSVQRLSKVVSEL